MKSDRDSLLLLLQLVVPVVELCFLIKRNVSWDDDDEVVSASGVMGGRVRRRGM